jgi:hypothetical protein
VIKTMLVLLLIVALCSTGGTLFMWALAETILWVWPDGIGLVQVLIFFVAGLAALSAGIWGYLVMDGIPKERT